LNVRFKRELKSSSGFFLVMAIFENQARYKPVILNWPMHKTFTPQDVIRFAYQEMNAAEEAAFTAELAECDETVAELSSIRNTVEWLDETAGQPKHSTIQTLLNYSKSLRIKKTSIDGLAVEVVLN
jgi:hypothetical protein